MTRPTLPSYSSSEVKDFHPFFKYAVIEILNSKNLTDAIAIESEFPTPTGPVDFALIDKSTNKVILPIEIKRTQSSLRSGGRRQARDYWSNLGSQRQTNFYCVSNLEITELFKYDNTKSRTSSQLIKLKNTQSGTFNSTDVNTFYANLIKCIDEILDIILGKTKAEYAHGLDEFEANIQAAVNNNSKWHHIFITTAFEYIRGASLNENNLKSLTSSWRPAAFYKDNPNRINDLGKKIDFAHIFCEPTPSSSDHDAFLAEVLKAAYESGKLLGIGDDIADLVNTILAPRGVGIVETDAELAQLMAIVAKAALGRELKPNERVLDPASGSGRLLTTLPITAFPSLRPQQVWAIEIENQFAEPLSLRLGLAFASVISPTNTPKITISSIENVDKDDFVDVKLVLMNPPFLSGIQASKLKSGFANRIKTISSHDSKVNEGQIALEALFLELVCNLVDTGSIITTIFPIQHLHRLSSEVVKLREYLVSDFGLSHIVIYPSTGIFESVIKQTVILIGKKGNIDPDISLIEVQTKVSDVDYTQLYSGLISGSSTPAYGVSVSNMSRNELISLAEDGWKKLIGAGSRVPYFMDRFFTGFKKLSDLPKQQIRRGTVGNNGNTGLTVFNSQKPAYPDVVKLIPKDWLRPVLNRTDRMPRVLDKSSTLEMSFLPPKTAYKKGHNDNYILETIINNYLKIEAQSNSKQSKRIKTKEEIIINIKSNQKEFGLGWVLIQRASRTKGEISILENDEILLSTNVPMIKLYCHLERKLLASWLLSVFGQIQLEYFSTPQEGMRKLEMNGIKRILYPDFSKISLKVKIELANNLINESAIDFSNVKLRYIDKLWSKILNPDDPSSCQDKAINLLQGMIDERKGFG